MGRREARIPSGAKKSTEPPNANSQEEATPRHPDPKPLKAKERRQEPKPREDGVPPSGERVADTGPRREDEMKGGEEVNPSTLRLREPTVLYIDGLIRGTLEGAKEEAIFRFGGTDVEVEVAFQREVVAVLLGVDDAGPGRHAGP